MEVALPLALAHHTCLNSAGQPLSCLSDTGRLSTTETRQRLSRDWKETADLYEQVGCDDAARWLSVEVELNVHVLAKAKGGKGVGESARHNKNR